MAAQGPARVPRTALQMAALRQEAEQLNERRFVEDLSNKDVQAALNQLQNKHGASGDEMRQVWGPIAAKNKERAAASNAKAAASSAKVAESGAKLAASQKELADAKATEAASKAKASESREKLIEALDNLEIASKKEIANIEKKQVEIRADMAAINADHAQKLKNAAANVQLSGSNHVPPPPLRKPVAEAKKAPERKEMKAAAKH